MDEEETMRNRLCALLAMLALALPVRACAQIDGAQAMSLAQTYFQSACGETAESVMAYGVSARLLSEASAPYRRIWRVVFSRSGLSYAVELDEQTGEVVRADDAQAFYLQRGVVDYAAANGGCFGIPRAQDLSALAVREIAREALAQRYGVKPEDLYDAPSGCVRYVESGGGEDGPWRIVRADGAFADPPLYTVDFVLRGDLSLGYYGGYFDPVTGEALHTYCPEDGNG